MSLFSLSLWMLVALAAVAVLIGGLIGWLTGAASARREAGNALRMQVEEARGQGVQAGRDGTEATLRPQLATSLEQVRALTEQRDEERLAAVTLREQAEGWRDDATDLRAQLVEATTQADADRHEAAQLRALEREQADDKLRLLVDAREALGHQFKALANDILEEKSKRFSEQNSASLGALLDPLRLRLNDFQGRVEQLYDTEGKERSALAEQVRQLHTLNQTMSEDARNLTNALKGSSKAQGNWGELILERVLEASGLQKGVEYLTQQSAQRDDGTRQQPDVLIALPEGRKLVIDAKVSLVGYDAYVRADAGADQEVARKAHVQSLRRHIDGLSAKRYERHYGEHTLDFVLLFVPIEPAFMLAVSSDERLSMHAWERNVLLVSPSTLLFVLRTVAHLWRQEAQTRNAQEIAKRGAELVDKLVGFVGDLEKIGKALDGAQGAYQDAFGKFTAGKGNAIRQAEMLRQLGVQPNKGFSAAALEAALPEGGGAQGDVLTGVAPLPVGALTIGAEAREPAADGN